MKIAHVKPAPHFLLSEICVGSLFDHLDKIYQRTDTVRYGVDKDPDYILCVATSTGRVSHFITTLRVDKVEQSEPLQIKTIRG